MRRLSAKERPGFLEGKSVFLSASVPTRENFPIDERVEWIIQQAAIAFVGTVMAEDGSLVFGGHPSMSRIVARVARRYVPVSLDDDGKRRITIYQSRYFDAHIPRETRDLERLGFARIVHTDADQRDLPFDPDLKKEQGLESLAAMRMRMLEEAQPIVMVAVGGMEGIYREAALFAQHRNPKGVFSLETTSAAARQLAHGNVVLDQVPIRRARSLEQEWIRSTGTEFPLEDVAATADSRRPFLPYLLMFQWLFEAIATKELPLD